MRVVLLLLIIAFGFDALGQSKGADKKRTIIAPIAEDTSVYTGVEMMPEFVGELNSFLSSNLKYPEGARHEDFESRVVSAFIVEKDGKLSNIHIIRSAGKVLDAEFIRVIKLMPRWKPGLHNGKPVRVLFRLPLHIHLD